MKNKKISPQGNSLDNNPAFATEIKKGIKKTDIKPIIKKTIKSKSLTIQEHIKGVLDNNRRILSQTITKIESNLPYHYKQAEKIVQELLPHAGKSIRIAVSGIPGSGKSTLIEKLGLFLIKEGYKVAVLAIDPTSSLSQGSILGDKTRMEKLASSSQSYIRPSPTGGNLGGVAKKTRETIIICEAAGYDIILLETVGIGQIEISARSMVDFFLLLLIAGTGDELQGIKKGVMEITDLVVINKTDGMNIQNSLNTKSKYENVLHFISPITKGWKQKVIACSAKENYGLDKLWLNIQNFINITKENKFFYQRRSNQSYHWFIDMINERLKETFYEQILIKDQIPIFKEKILNNKLFPPLAVKKILELFMNNKNIK